MAITNVLASVAVRDLVEAIAWYSAAPGREPDTRPMPEVAEWRFPAGGVLQVYCGTERTGGGSCTLVVEDLDRTIGDLRAAGVEPGDEAGGESVRTVIVKDADGNSLAFAQPLTAAVAR